MSAANGAVEVDDWSQTAVPSIYAVGDVTDRLALTPVAIREGHAFAETVFGGRPRAVDHALVPTAVFTQPEAATVGLTEAEARGGGAGRDLPRRLPPAAEHAVRPGRADADEARGRGQDSRKVLGVHIVGHGAAEMIQLAAVALRMGATKEDFDRTMAVHPTAAEELVTMRAPVPVTT